MNTQNKKSNRTPTQTRIINQTTNAILVSDTLKDATQILRISVSGLNKRLKQFPEIKQKLTLQTIVNPELAQIKLQQKTLEAVEELSRLLKNSPKDDIRLRSAQDILNRAGITNKSNTNVQVNILNQIKADQKEYDL